MDNCFIRNHEPFYIINSISWELRFCNSFYVPRLRKYKNNDMIRPKAPAVRPPGYWQSCPHVLHYIPWPFWYLDLKEVLDGKEYFILTTNCDIQIPKVFPEDRIFQFQGDFHYFQCCQPCHDAIYDNHDVITDMLNLPQEILIPESIQARSAALCGNIADNFQVLIQARIL